MQKTRAISSSHLMAFHGIQNDLMNRVAKDFSLSAAPITRQLPLMVN
jgi:hypothetical protein